MLTQVIGPELLMRSDMASASSLGSWDYTPFGGRLEPSAWRMPPRTAPASVAPNRTPCPAGSARELGVEIQTL